jgi:hypothetical protein
MNTVTRRSPINLALASIEPNSAVLPGDDDLRVARLRLRHLAPWHVEPLPTMHSSLGTPKSEPLTQGGRERSKHLALQVLAIQMCQAAATSALD